MFYLCASLAIELSDDQALEIKTPRDMLVGGHSVKIARARACVCMGGGSLNGPSSNAGLHPHGPLNARITPLLEPVLGPALLRWQDVGFAVTYYVKYRISLY